MTDNPKATFEHLKEFVLEAMEKTGVPGVAVGILYEEKI